MTRDRVLREQMPSCPLTAEGGAPRRNRLAWLQVAVGLLLSCLLLLGCGTSPPTLPSTATATLSDTGVGPGLWPTGMPAPPSPTTTAGSASAASTASTQGAGTVGALPSTIAPTGTVAISVAPGWTTFESINEIRDLAFAPDGTLWTATSGGLVHWNLKAQTGARPPYTRYAIHARALSIAPDGTLWLALAQGLCHFDGASCETYTQVDGLIGSEVYTIAVAGDGTVWVGTGQGVGRFDGHSWQSYPSPVATYDLAVSTGGEVWAATSGGLGRYRPAEDGWFTYTAEHGLPGSNAQVIAAGPGGEVWAYLVWEGVYRFDGAGWQKVERTGEPAFDIAFAADGTPWIATTGGMHYPGGSLSYHDGTQWRDVTGDQKLHSFTSVALGPGGIVAASTQVGLGLYEGGEWRLLRDGPTSDRVTSVAVTAGGDAWFAFGDHSISTPGLGLSRFDGQGWDYFLDDAEVNVLAVGPDGTLWAGAGCGVQRFDGATWEIVARCEDLPAGSVMDIDFAPDGAVWVANGFGLARFDGRSWTVYERLAHSLQVAPDGTIWMSGWEGTQGSSYVARFDGETWTTLSSANAFPGGFAVRAVTPDGLLWGTTPESGLVSFDDRRRQTSQAWTDGESWTYYESPGGSQNRVALLAVAPDNALWLATGGAIARFDRASPPDEAWTFYTADDGLPDSYSHALAFGPGGEVWFGATRFQPAKAGANAERSTDAQRIVETALPVATRSPELPTPYCRPSEAFVDLSVPTTEWAVGQVLTVTVTLANADESDAQLSQILYSLSVQPDSLVSGNMEPVEHPVSIAPRDFDQARFVLRAEAPGRLLLTGSASYEMHALDYSWGSWSGCQSQPLEITIIAQ